MLASFSSYFSSDLFYGIALFISFLVSFLSSSSRFSPFTCLYFFPFSLFSPFPFSLFSLLIHVFTFSPSLYFSFSLLSILSPFTCFTYFPFSILSPFPSSLFPLLLHVFSFFSHLSLVYIILPCSLIPFLLRSLHYLAFYIFLHVSLLLNRCIMFAFNYSFLFFVSLFSCLTFFFFYLLVLVHSLLFHLRSLSSASFSPLHF